MLAMFVIFKGGGKLFGNKRISDLQSISKPKRARPNATSNIKKSTVSSNSTKPSLATINLQPDLSMERIETHNLKGKIVVVEPGVDLQMKHRLERIVAKHGGM